MSLEILILSGIMNPTKRQIDGKLIYLVDAEENWLNLWTQAEYP
jgi:hypothetical protein